MGKGGFNTALATATLGPLGYVLAKSATAPSAKVSTNAAQDVAEDEEVAKKARATLLETSGGILGEEVASGRKTLLGN